MGEIDSSAERLINCSTSTPSWLITPTRSTSIASIRWHSRCMSFEIPGRERLRPSTMFSFVVRPGESLALVGPSGSGKTTIVKLLMRFYDPTEGRVLINGRDLSLVQFNARMRAEARCRSFRRCPVQRQHRRDITLQGRHLVRQVRDAAAAAHADDFIQRLPKGYETLVGERGIKLSGGEKQRVAIARARS